MLADLLLIRHGQTEWSRDGRHTGRTDVPLLPEGRTQAETLVSVLSRVLAGRALAAAWSSPLGRARETASIVVPDDSPRVSDLLREFDYGDYEGLTTPQIRAARPGWDLWRDGCPAGETAEAVGARAREFLAAVRAAAPDGPVAVFSHGHFLRILATQAVGLPAQDGRLVALSTASLSVVGSEHGRPVISLWNATGSRP